MGSPARKGLTLIEVMAAIGIIAVLMTLLIPAIRSARDAARQRTCVNNLLQLGLAMHNYHAANGTFPIGAMGRHGKGYPLSGDPTGAGNRRTWTFLILPYLDSMTPLYNEINFSSGFDAPVNSTCARTQVAGYVCPADPGNAARVDSGLPTERARGNYAVNWGGTHFNQSRGPDPFVGPLGSASFGGAPFAYDASFPIASITDGTSNTLLMSELLNPFPNVAPADRRGDLYSDDPNAAMFMGYAPPNATTPDQMPGVAGSPGCLLSGGGAAPCNRMTPAFNAARSTHPGSVNALMADGSVRFPADTTDPRTWQALSTSRSPDVIGPDSY